MVLRLLTQRVDIATLAFVFYMAYLVHFKLLSVFFFLQGDQYQNKFSRRIRFRSNCWRENPNFKTLQSVTSSNDVTEDFCDSTGIKIKWKKEVAFNRFKNTHVQQNLIVKRTREQLIYSLQKLRWKIIDFWEHKIYAYLITAL